MTHRWLLLVGVLLVVLSMTMTVAHAAPSPTGCRVVVCHHKPFHCDRSSCR